jgi:vanillate O-demethylase monooxygenase subunit
MEVSLPEKTTPSQGEEPSNARMPRARTGRAVMSVAAAGREPAAPPTASYLRDCWYAGAWSSDVQDAPLDRTICGERIALFRRPDGAVAALSGVCPHRFAPLGRGRLVDGRLQCPYHGLEFGADGLCALNPHGPLPRLRPLATYPVVERDSMIWLWIGDPARADPALIPAFDCLTDRRYRTIRGTLVTRAHFELITDNLLDLSHVAYLHAGGIGGDAVKDGEHSVVQMGTTVHSNRWCPNGRAAPTWAALFGGYQDPVDHWLNMRWDAPSTMLLDVGITPAGRPRSEGITVWGAHILTPETEISTHYFWAASRDFALEDDALDVSLAGSLEHAFVGEDKPMIEEVQRNLAGRTFDEMRPPVLGIDVGAMRARRVLGELRSGRGRQAPSQGGEDSIPPPLAAG